MAGERGLDRHLGGRQVADLADHDDVRVLPHQRAQAFGEAEVDGGCTCVWLKAGSIISIGSSIVQTFTSSVASRFSVEYSVVVLPDAGGAGDQDDAVRPRDQLLPALRVVRAEKPSASRSLTAVSGSKMRITIFSPKAVGRVDRRISTSAPSLSTASGAWS